MSKINSYPWNTRAEYVAWGEFAPPAIKSQSQNFRAGQKAVWGEAFAVGIADAFNHGRKLPQAIQELLVKGRV